MLYRLIALSAVLLLTACATPADLKVSGEHGSVDAAMAVPNASRCLQTGFENLQSHIRTRLSPINAGGAQELLVWGENSALGVMEITALYPTVSQIEYWVDKDYAPDPRHTILRLLGRCRR